MVCAISEGSLGLVYVECTQRNATIVCAVATIYAILKMTILIAYTNSSSHLSQPVAQL